MIKSIIQILSHNTKSSTEFITTSTLAKMCGVSSKTIQRHLKEVNSLLNNNGATLNVVPGKGLQIKIQNKKLFSSLSSNLARIDDHFESPKQRIDYLIQFFLSTNYFIKKTYFIKVLFISESQLAKDLIHVRKYFSTFNLSLISIQKKGLHLVGSEKAKRACISDLNFKNTDNLNSGQLSDFEFVIKHIIQDVLLSHNINMTEISLHHLALHILICIQRVLGGNEIIDYDLTFLKKVKKKDAFIIASEFSHKIRSVLNIQLGYGEILYLATRFTGKQQYDHISEINTTQESSNEVKLFINLFLKSILKETGIDFYDDSELFTNLQLHTASLLERIQNKSHIQNPLLDEIKRKYSFAYELATVGLIAVHSRLNISFSEDEIGTYALHIALALERKENGIKHFNIIIVCSTGRASAHLLAYQLKNEFNKSIQTIKIISNLQLPEVNLSTYDFLLTTIPLDSTLPIPIIKITTLLTDTDISSIKLAFSQGSNNNTSVFFPKKLFFTNIIGKNQSEVLNEIVTSISKFEFIPSDFFNSIIIREHFSSTAIGNFIAIPHPNEPITTGSFISVSVLKKPILWGEKLVQIIFLISISSQDKFQLSNAYKQIAEFSQSNKAVQQLTANPTFACFQEIIESQSTV